MSALLMIAALAAPPPPDPSRLPPEPVERPSIRDLPAGEAPAAIFTYSVDGACRVTGITRLQGPKTSSWEDVEQAHQVSGEETVWRFVDGLRRQLTERRVKLLGEMVLEGELVCYVLPSGDVAQAWVERRDSRLGRRRAPTREPVPVRGGSIPDLGTFSVDLPGPDPAS